MTRECTGCGLHHCDGECFHESDPDAVEFAENMKLLREKYGDLMALRDADSTSGDPFEKARRVA